MPQPCPRFFLQKTGKKQAGVHQPTDSSSSKSTTNCRQREREREEDIFVSCRQSGTCPHRPKMRSAFGSPAFGTFPAALVRLRAAQSTPLRCVSLRSFMPLNCVAAKALDCLAAHEVALICEGTWSAAKCSAQPDAATAQQNHSTGESPPRAWGQCCARTLAEHMTLGAPDDASSLGSGDFAKP